MIAFEVLCKKKSAYTLLDIIRGLTNDDAKFIDSGTNWASATKWWMRPQHLKLLHKDYTESRQQRIPTPAASCGYDKFIQV